MLNQQNETDIPNPRRRGCLIWLGWIAALIIGLMVLGVIYESGAKAADAKAYPPPGELVDVGGYRLHINCTGSGSPTVVIDAGQGDWSTSWRSVQEEVAKTTRICTYDRAGLGWSEAGPLPRDAAQFAKELHTLLQNANVPGPYVMVGHSLGGTSVRVFVSEHASEVAGVVLIDSMNPGQATQPYVQAQSQSDPQSQPFSLQAALARFGIARLIVKLPVIASSVEAGQEAYYPLFVRTQSLQTSANELGGVPASLAQADAVKTFGDLPLIVLTARLNTNPGWPQWQKELLELSSNSQQLFAKNSGHTIQADEPEAAVAAILQMVEQVRQSIKK
ncbi:MAG TPA: alpha/beta hydrolase [Anaerolineales bacterium]|nr:alpha/beta hydrolase [Anaerolineales bacterium]